MKHKDSRKKIVKERRLYPSTNRKYTLNDISNWIKYGLQLGVIKRSGEKEDVEMMMKWIDMLDKGNINVQFKIGMYRNMERQLESVRQCRIRKHNFLNNLSEVCKLLNIKETETYVDKVNDITERLIELHQQRFELDKKIMEVDMEFSNINSFIKSENGINTFELVVNSNYKNKDAYLERLSNLGFIPMKEYEEIKEYLWIEKKKNRQSYQLPQWM